MGGPGSGRRGTSKVTPETCRWLDVNELARRGCLKPGYEGYWIWQSPGGGMAAAVQLNAKPECLIIQYRYSKGQDDPEVVAETVNLARRPCHYGGQRLYFVCPELIISA